MCAKRLPAELLELIFSYVIIPNLELRTFPVSVQSSIKSKIDHAQTIQKKKLRRRAIRLALVCRSWRQAATPLIFKYISIVQSPTSVVEHVAHRLRRLQYGSPLGIHVKDLYVTSRLYTSDHFSSLLDIFESCKNMETLFVG